ncbi:hypothetical protein F4802DRAFT_611011 [Xylaria palmicola]|nr:hypothetical protein F4802DRAFT_611011 [Xylaria palmicola]
MARARIASGNTELPNISHKLSISEQNQKLLRQQSKNNPKFSPQEISAFELDSKESFEQFWRATVAAKSDFDKRHEHGAAKIAGRTRRLIDSAALVWSDIAPILDLIEHVGSPFSGIAIGTIGFVFTVARNRVKMESQISATLKSIQDRLPGIETYKRIYQIDGKTDERLNSTVRDAYYCFIEFCIATLAFHTMGSLSRWLKAIGRSTSLDDEAKSVEQAIVDIRLVVEELLNKNVADVKALNEELQSANDEQRLETISEILGVARYSPEIELAKLTGHRRNIEADHNWYYRQQTLKDPLSFTKDNQLFKSWKASDNSRILLLTGHNMVRQATHCWLSPVALDIISECQKARQGYPCVFYVLGAQAVDDTFVHVASSLLLRLLSTNRDVLRDEKRYDELRAELQFYQTLTRSSSGAHQILECLSKVASRVLKMFDSSTVVWIVLDRLDKCHGDGSRNFHRKMLLNFLVKLVKDEDLRLRVRVLGVVNGVDWKPEDCLDEIEKPKEGSLVLWSLEQAQRR